MKLRSTSLMNFSMMLLLTISNASCASSPMPLPPRLESRTLRISKKVPGFEYQWFVCTSKGLFGRCKEETVKIEYFDLTDPSTREKLINMGFVAKVREKVLP